uniref:Uncharacterized protein n=1 Tax=viral metagenome TaxID=1070528 RepID=A0A6C0H3T2_9ZZZZ
MNASLSNYDKFIRNFLVSHCYMEYCKLCVIVKTCYRQKKIVDISLSYNGDIITTDMPVQECVDNNKYAFQDKIHDRVIWNTVFQKLEPVLYYYLYRLLLSHSVSISFTHMIQIYDEQTFQDFVDSRMNMQCCGAHEYQQFIQNMKDETFKKNMYSKFENEMALRRLKNHLVYIILVYLKKNKDTFMTDTEMEYIDTVMDVTAYFEYVSNHMNIRTEKENKVLEFIDRMLFV